MFDEEPKDIFEGTDKAPSTPTAPMPSGESQSIQAPPPIAPPPTRLPSSYGSVPPGSSMDGPMPETGNGGGIKIVLIVVGILVIFGVSGFFAYRIMVQPAVDGSVVDAVPDTGVVTTDTPTTTPPASTTPTTSDPEPTTQAPVQTTNPASLLDSDGDGLTNARELEVGTSVTKADTDGDGLGDREEVEVYGTDPRKTDTDSDGYLDGQEVSGGYNPNGEGKLFTVPQGS